MFKIFTFKQLAKISFILCFFMLLSALHNNISKSTPASAQSSVNVPIIMYHQVCNTTSAGNDYTIPLELLRQDFQYIKDNNIHPISFNQLYRYVKTGEALPQNPIIITFDDGERSFLTKVVPLTEEFSYPVNVNIIGSLVDLYTKNGETDDRYAYLNEQDIKALNDNPLVEIGCHTYNLHSLNERHGMKKLKSESDEAYEKLIRADIRAFQQKLFELTGKRAIYFAYPYGSRSNTLLEILKSEGFVVTLTCRESTNRISVGSDLFELGRYNRPCDKSSNVFFNSIFSEAS